MKLNSPFIASVLPTSLAIFILVFGFQNCGMGFKAVGSASGPSISGQTPQCIQHQMISAMMAKAPKMKMSPSLQSRAQLNTGTKIVVLADNECLQDDTKNKGFLSAMILAQGLRTEAKKIAYRLTLSQNISNSDITQASENDPCIESVDFHTTYKLFATAPVLNDPGYSNQTHLSFINHSQVYAQIFNSSNGINQDTNIAIVDSGTDVTHPDLAANILANSAYNAYNGGTNVADAAFHGTHVTGLAAAVTGNSVGVSGVLGNFAKIIPIKIAADTSTNPVEPDLSLDAGINGIRWAADHGAEVINISWGGNTCDTASQALHDALQYAVDKGATIVIAAGNDGKQMTDYQCTPDAAHPGQFITNAGQYNTWPAAFAATIDGVIAIGSLDAGTALVSDFSNFSSKYVELLAPGANGTHGILSTVPVALTTPNAPYASLFSFTDPATNTTYTNVPIEGTSMASPVAAGSAAMLIGLAKSRGIKPTPRQVERALLAGSRKVASTTGQALNGNTLDLAAMVAFVDAQTGVSSSSTTARSAVHGNIIFSQQPSSAAKIVGDSVEFDMDLSASGNILANIQWMKNGHPITGQNTEKLVLTNLSTSDAGSYTARVTVGTTVKDSSPAVLQVGTSYCN